jgi:hypothetical protein
VVICPYLKSWKVTGKTPSSEAVILSEVWDRDLLAGHKVHSFTVGKGVLVNGITFAMTDHNNGGSSQSHIGRLTLSGRVY